MFLLSLLLACAPHTVPPSGPSSPVIEGSTISPPVTLEQFRAAFPVGTKIRLRMEAAGEPTVEAWWEWTKVDAEGCSIKSELHDANGVLIADEGESRSTWATLMGHADFPADRTEWTESHIEVPAGSFDTWLFTVREEAEDGTPVVRRYHFARKMPGPPLLFTTEQGGQEMFRMTMLARSPMP